MYIYAGAQMHVLTTTTQGCATTAHWLVSYLSSDGLKYLKPYLVEGRSRYDSQESFFWSLSRAFINLAYR